MNFRRTYSSLEHQTNSCSVQSRSDNRRTEQGDSVHTSDTDWTLTGLRTFDGTRRAQLEVRPSVGVVVMSRRRSRESVVQESQDVVNEASTGVDRKNS